MVVLYTDLDKLKYLNDTCGHEIGDLAIQTLANQLENHTSESGLSFRLGGDEFLTLDIYESEEKTERVIEDIRKNLRLISRLEAMPIELSASFGYVVTDVSAKVTLNEYMKQADNLMYEDKKARRQAR